MAQIQGFIAISHSPFWNMAEDVDGAGAEFAHAAYRARALVAEHAPDALVVFGPDHFRNFFYDVMPAFCIGFETVDAVSKGMQCGCGSLGRRHPVGRFPLPLHRRWQRIDRHRRAPIRRGGEWQ